MAGRLPLKSGFLRVDFSEVQGVALVTIFRRKRGGVSGRYAPSAADWTDETSLLFSESCEGTF